MDGARKRHNARNVMERGRGEWRGGEGGFRDFHVNASTRVQLFGGQLEGSLRLDLNDPLFTRSSPISAIRDVERGWFRSTMGRIRLRQICTPPNATSVAFEEDGEKRQEAPHLLWRSSRSRPRPRSPLAPFMNILGILMRFPDNDPHSRIRANPVVVIPSTSRPRCRRRRFREPWHANSAARRTCLKFAESLAEY